MACSCQQYKKEGGFIRGIKKQTSVNESGQKNGHSSQGEGGEENGGVKRNEMSVPKARGERTVGKAREKLGTLVLGNVYQ